jgi:hypothetical protein
MNNDELLRQWQQWLAAFDPAMRPPSAASPWWTPPPAAPSYADVLERFAAAARAAQGGAGAAPAGMGAGDAAGSQFEAGARAFSDWLREQFRDPASLWGGNALMGGAPGGPAPVGSAIPPLGPWREHQLRSERITRAWQRMEEARQRCARMWSDVLREAAQVFARRLADPTQAASTEGGRKLYDEWISIAEEAYARMAHSDAYVSAQGELINAGGELRRELTEYAEVGAKFLDLPTRSELNAVHERMRALQQLVQKLEAQLATLHAKRSAPRAQSADASRPDPARDGSAA